MKRLQIRTPDEQDQPLLFEALRAACWDKRLLWAREVLKVCMLCDDKAFRLRMLAYFQGYFKNDVWVRAYIDVKEIGYNSADDGRWSIDHETMVMTHSQLPGLVQFAPVEAVIAPYFQRLELRSKARSVKSPLFIQHPNLCVARNWHGQHTMPRGYFCHWSMSWVGQASFFYAPGVDLQQRVDWLRQRYEPAALELVDTRSLDQFIEDSWQHGDMIRTNHQRVEALDMTTLSPSSDSFKPWIRSDEGKPVLDLRDHIRLVWEPIEGNKLFHYALRGFNKETGNYDEIMQINAEQVRDTFVYYRNPTELYA